jgi:hypothetical protein
LVDVGIGIGVGDGVGVGVGDGEGVGLCAKPGVAADIITTSANATAIAVMIRRKPASPIVCRVLAGCEVQHMTINPKAKWWHAKMQHGLRRMRRFVPNCHGGSTVRHVITAAFAPDCASAATGRKLHVDVPGPILKSARGLLTRDFHVAISDTIGIGRSAVRFATLRLEQTSGSPFVAWHAKKSGRVVFVSSGGD